MDEQIKLCNFDVRCVRGYAGANQTLLILKKDANVHADKNLPSV